MSISDQLKNRTVLITGASRGIGKFAALEAAKRGAHIIAVARTQGALEALDDEIIALGSTATLVPLKLEDFAAIDRLGEAIFNRFGSLDGLIGNAAMLGTLSPVPHLTPKEVDKVMAINFTANYRLIRSLDLPLRKAEAARSVFISSSVAKTAKPYWGLYAASKAALNTIVKSYAGEIKNTKMAVNIFQPGATRTAMRAKAMPGEDPKTLPHPSEITAKLIDMIAPDYVENGKLYDVVSDSLSDI